MSPAPLGGLLPGWAGARQRGPEGAIPSGLKLVDSRVSTIGVVMGTYEPAGEIVTGSFALAWGAGGMVNASPGPKLCSTRSTRWVVPDAMHAVVSYERSVAG